MYWGLVILLPVMLIIIARSLKKDIYKKITPTEVGVIQFIVSIIKMVFSLHLFPLQDFFAVPYPQLLSQPGQCKYLYEGS